MSFFFNLQKKKGNKEQKQAVSLDLCYKHGCKVCPKNKDEDLKNAKMEPTGSDNPIIYILGEAPGREEDLKGRQFIGDSGCILRQALKDVFGKDYVDSSIRINNCVRCRPYTITRKKRGGTTFQSLSNRTPTIQEITCCKKSVEKDIEYTKPTLIIGAGNIPLHWMLNQTGINKWRGRIVPVKVGQHVTWFLSILDPAFILRQRGKKDYATEYDEVFNLDLKKAKELLSKKKSIPRVIDGGYGDNIYFVTGKNKDDFQIVTKWLDHLKTLDITAIDIETSSLKPWEGGKILTVSIGTDKETYAFPIEHPDGWKDSDTIREIKELLEDFLLNSGVKVAHNLKFELIWFLHYFGTSVIYETEWADTMSQAYVLDERSGSGTLSLDTQCLQHFGFNLKAICDVDAKKILSYKIEDVLLYNGMDTKYTYKLFIRLSTVMPIDLKYTEKHHNDVCKTLALTETKGVLIDLKTNTRISKKLEREARKIEEQLYNLPEIARYEKKYNEKFNFASSPQLVKMLRDVLLIPSMKMTSKKNYSTDKEVLQILADKGIKLAVYIEKLRGINKLKSTYVDSLPDLACEDGILRASFNSCVTDTGRFSSTEPNMQNFPKRNNSYVRRQVIAPKGFKFVAADYGQLEARVICMASGETNIIEHDVHADWSRRIIKLYPRAAKVRNLDELTPKDFKKFRSKIKNGLVFPWFYGAGKNSVGKSLGLPNHVVNKLYKDFYEYFSRVKIWQDKMLKFYEKHGYVIGLTGRRRRPPLSRNQLLNNTIQGTASDIVVAAMNRLSRMSYDTGIDYYQPILNIHDDLSFYIPENEVEEAVNTIAKEMVRDYSYMNGTPLEVEIAVGNNWYALEEYGTFSLANLQ